MNRDLERIERNREALREGKLDAIVCSLPMNVLLLSGYWPVVGTSLVVFTSEGRSVLLAPEDERQLAESSWADEIRTFTTGSLTKLKSPVESIKKPLQRIFKNLDIANARVAIESGAATEPASYAAINLYNAGVEQLLMHEFSTLSLVPATDLLRRLSSTLTADEIRKLRDSCNIAQEAYLAGSALIQNGMSEIDVAEAFHTCMLSAGQKVDSVARADGFIYCMSGENSFEASAAFQRSRRRKLKNGDYVLIHCNSYADGYWTDITRTYCLGEPDEQKRKMYAAVFAARRSALAEIAPGVRASRVDAAAREVINEHGFGKEFVHGLGHAVGFHAIDHNAPPRLHPASPDILEAGMVFNVEPAIYIRDLGGIRHCDMVVVTENGPEVLTDFQSEIDELIVGSK